MSENLNPIVDKMIDELSETSFEECCRFFILVRLIEEIRYKQGFEDGLKFAKIYSEDLKELRRFQLEFLNDVFRIYQSNIASILQELMRVSLSRIVSIAMKGGLPLTQKGK